MKKNIYEISTTFQNNYFYKNAFERYMNSIQEFMFWRRGSFLLPPKKQVYIDTFLQEEQDKFYKEGIFSLPSVQFAITTRCTLRCQDCSVMIPRFADTQTAHIETTFAQFKQNLDALLAAVEHIRSLLILGGEPLLHKELPEIVAYAASQEKIGLVDIVTNCTILPSPELINAVREYRHKTFFGLSNYTKNQDIVSLLKREEIINVLKKNDIKHSLDTGNGKWFRYTLEKCDCTQDQLKSIFTNCQWHHCLYVLGDILAICPRSLVGHTLGAFTLNDADMICLTQRARERIREKLLTFFEKNFLDACRYCRRHSDLVDPAIQMKKTQPNI